MKQFAMLELLAPPTTTRLKHPEITTTYLARHSSLLAYKKNYSSAFSN